MIRSLLIAIVISLGVPAHSAECPDFSGRYAASAGQSLKLARGLTGGYETVDQDHNIFNFYLGHAELGDGDVMDTSCAEGKITIVELTNWDLDLENSEFAVTGNEAQDARIRQLAERARAAGQSVSVRSREVLALELASDPADGRTGGLTRTGTSRLEFVNSMSGESFVATVNDEPIRYERLAEGAR